MLRRLLFSLAVSQHLLCSGLRSVCYDEMRSNLNCFDLWPPYTNSNWHLPASPTDQNIQFRLFTTHNRHNAQLLRAMDAQSFHSSNFNAHQDTKVIVHGFTSSGETDWIPAMVDELLRHPVNVIVVDWAKGAEGPNYFQATANTRVVGAQIASLIMTAEQMGSSASRFHVIGHSLGAQIAGYAGQGLNGRLGRISGLDPAAPLFENYDDELKLEKTDAVFVDVMHTDAQPLHEAGLGTVDLIGHLDFFPNGGADMPGCPADKFNWVMLLTGQITALTDDISCSHNRAPWYFVASINDNLFNSFPCANRNTHCNNCHAAGGAGCISMGYHATKPDHRLFPSYNSLYYAATGPSYPY